MRYATFMGNMVNNITINDPHVNRRIGRRRFIKSWAWPSEVEDFLKEKSEGFTIHICSGSSKLGDVTIDQFMPAMVKADMYNLPLRTGIADTVICDPPWGIARHVRHKLLFELRRVLKLGGSKCTLLIIPSPPVVLQIKGGRPFSQRQVALLSAIPK